MELLSLENRVDKDTPPTFLWHNFGDTGVPCEASLTFASALYRNEVPCEVHLWSEGKHGVGLGTYMDGDRTYNQPLVCAKWMQLSIDFLYRFFEANQ